jgi:plasmid replication initiation protein
MNEEQSPCEAVTTPETLGVTPRYVLMHNAISRSVQNLSATAKKLTAMAMALLPPDLSSRTVSFSFTAFCNALGFGDGGEQYRLFKDAVMECMKCVISLEIVSPKTGKKYWKNYTWFSFSEYNEETGQVTMTFALELADLLKEFRRLYAKINLNDLGCLQSKYALRYFEMAKSYESLAGKDGNQAGHWYFERTIPELRQLFAIPADTYQKTNDLKRYVVDVPVGEINKVEIGIKVTTEKVKQGRRLCAMRFNCEKVARPVKSKQRRGKSATVELPASEPRSVDTRVDKENQHLRELYPAEFALLYEQALTKTPTLGQKTVGKLGKKAAEAVAFAGLRAMYGIVK